MDKYENRYKHMKDRWVEYDHLRQQLSKNRRIIYIGSCLLCLFIGFMVGMVMFYPKESVVLAVDVPTKPEVQAQTTSI